MSHRSGLEGFLDAQRVAPQDGVHCTLKHFIQTFFPDELPLHLVGVGFRFDNLMS